MKMQCRDIITKSVTYFSSRCLHTMCPKINICARMLSATTQKANFVRRGIVELLLFRLFQTRTSILRSLTYLPILWMYNTPQTKQNCSFLMQHDTDKCKTVWDPVQIFHCPANCKHAIVVLNTPIRWKDSMLLQIWEKAEITVTVDGGTYKWLKYLEEQHIDVLNGENNSYLPHLITGDMDSCSPLFLEKLKHFGVTIVETPDQSHTDYTKALLKLGQYIKEKNINLNRIYVLVETSGRFDHIIANINTLYKCDQLVGDIQVIQVASNSLTWLLKPGFHSILVPEILVKNNVWCGLLPFGSSVNHITTTGLKWNLNGATMHFGDLISTSNTYSSTEVTVNTDTPVVWTMGVEPLKDTTTNCSDS